MNEPHPGHLSPREPAADPAEVARAVGRRCADARGPARVDTRQTHISWLFLAADHAYKLKKPLVLGFVDYATPERRRDMCRAEVRLNRRLAPDLYLGVRAIVPSGDGVEIGDEDDPRAVDYVVEMRRYDEDQTLAAVVRRGEADSGQLHALGAALARFHQGCPAVTGSSGAARALASVERNLDELQDELPAGAEELGRVQVLGRFLQAFVRARTTTLDRRAATGRVREGHADLRAEHVVLRPALSVVDCVEFDPELRTLDVADDLGFLVMDLAALEAEAAGREVVAGYRDTGGDCGTDQLLWFYAVHRALVRVKVALVRAAQEAGDGAEAGVDRGAGGDGSGQQSAARHLLGVAEHLAWRARGPLVLAVCGVPGSGKSYVAAALAAAYGLPVVSSDLVRKELAGLEPHERASPAAYTPEVSARTYEALAKRAAGLVPGSGCVLVDATFRRREDRECLRRSVAPAARLVFAECLTPAPVLADRVRRREQDPQRVSDADAAVAARLRGEWEPLDEVPAADHLPVRTDRPVEGVIGDLMALLDERL